MDELAIIARPGAASRRPETKATADALKPYRRLFTIREPGTLDGGDVLCVDKTLFVGLSGRTNRAGADQLSAYVEPHGYAVKPVRVEGCLHLKSAATKIGPQRILINHQWLEPDALPGMERIEIHPSEPYAANALLIGETVVYPSSYPLTQEKMEAAGVRVWPVELSELAKAEGAVTCCSLIFNA
jgi:dimethylargininase